MTLERALASLEDRFGAADDTSQPSEMCEICSGGEPVEIDGERQPPLLCASRELAIAAWFAAMRHFLSERQFATWRIIDGPHIDKFFMTMMDEKKNHRIAGARYCVSARIGVTSLQTDNG